MPENGLKREKPTFNFLFGPLSGPFFREKNNRKGNGENKKDRKIVTKIIRVRRKKFVRNATIY